MLQDFVHARIMQTNEALRVLSPLKRKPNRASWSLWNYPKQHVNYVEIGTSDFDALLHRHVWRQDVVGYSLEPVRTYFNNLPTNGGANKTLLNVAVSDYDGYEDVF